MGGRRRSQMFWCVTIIILVFWAARFTSTYTFSAELELSAAAAAAAAASFTTCTISSPPKLSLPCSFYSSLSFPSFLSLAGQLVLDSFLFDCFAASTMILHYKPSPGKKIPDYLAPLQEKYGLYSTDSGAFAGRYGWTCL